MGNSGESAKRSSDALDGVMKVFRGIGNVIGTIGSWIFRLRKILLSLPVLFFAVKLALDNMNRLPEEVGLNLQANGEFAITVTKGLAVMGPLGITAACLLLMLCSRKVLYPWIISLFTLVLPLLILFMNAYPA